MLVFERVFEQASVMKRRSRTRTGKQHETEQSRRENKVILWIYAAQDQSLSDTIEGACRAFLVRQKHTYTHSSFDYLLTSREEECDMNIYSKKTTR